MNQASVPTIYFSLLIVTFFWGTSFAAAKIGLEELSPLNLTILRSSFATAIFVALLPVMPGNKTIAKRDIPQFILLGLTAITSYFYIQYTGLALTTSINAALILATSPLCAALFGILLAGERITFSGAIGILSAFCGISLIITNGKSFGIFQSYTFTGDLLLLFNAVVWAGFTVYGKSLLKRYRPLIAMAYIHIFGTALLLPFAFFETPLTPVPLLRQVSAISWPTAASTLYMAVFCSVLAYYVWYKGVERIGAVRTAAFSYFNPLVAIITGILLLHETPTPYIATGGLMIITGVYLLNKSAHPRQKYANPKEQPCHSEARP